MDFSELSLRELQEKYRNGELKFEKKTQNSRRKITSAAWEKFKVIEAQRGNSFVPVKNFVFCESCKMFQTYNGITTTALKSHNCISPNQQRMDNVIINKAIVKFVDVDKKLIRDGATRFVVDDLRPFYAIEGTGLNALIGVVLNIAKKYPNASADDIMNLLPSRTTLRNHVVESAKSKIEAIKTELQSVLIYPGEFSVAVDLWKDQYKAKHYVGVVAHYYIEKKRRCSSKKCSAECK